MRPSHARRKGRRYRYYLSTDLVVGSVATGDSGWRIPAGEIEAAVSSAVAARLREPGFLSEVLQLSQSAPEASTRHIGQCSSSWKDPVHGERKAAHGFPRYDGPRSFSTRSSSTRSSCLARSPTARHTPQPLSTSGWWRGPFRRPCSSCGARGGSGEPRLRQAPGHRHRVRPAGAAISSRGVSVPRARRRSRSSRD